MSTKVVIPDVANKKQGVLNLKTVVYPKYKKTYIHILADESEYVKYLSKSWLVENMLIGAVGKGVLFIGDEKLICDYVKSYCKFIASKILKSTIPDHTVKYENIKLNKVEVSVFGKCKSFVRSHMIKESKKLISLDAFVSKLQIKPRTEVKGTNKTISKNITIDFNKKILVDLAFGYWDVDFVVVGDRIIVDDVVTLEQYNAFKAVNKSFKNKVPANIFTHITEIVNKVHGINNVQNNDFELIVESTKVAKKFC